MSDPFSHDQELPHVIVLVGATGDLSQRKLLPGLLHLFQAGLVRHSRIIGTSLDDLDTPAFVELARVACQEGSNRKVDDEQWRDFAGRLEYVPQAAGPAALRDAVIAAEKLVAEEVEREHPGELAEVRRLHYLSVPPKAALQVVHMLDDAGLVERARIVMEKPFGTDLASAKALNDELHEVFTEDQIFRIDHFLGKEAAQNILAFRFANGLFEPIWNRNHIDHVQIDVPETLGLEGRTAFYEATGAYKDMVVTHLFQVLAFTAMEPPTSLEPGPIGEEKNKVFRSLRPIEPQHVVRGQYVGYRDKDGVPADSDTETFIALRAEIDNWRWAGVPFYLRTGKKLAEGARIISIAFKEPPRTMFPAGSGVGTHGPDHLTFDLADSSRLSLSFYGKRPGPGMKLDKLSMQFALHDTHYAGGVLEAYERLIHDAMRGDHTLFTTAEGVEQLWEKSRPLLASPPPVRPYPPGSWGPNAIHQLITPHAWRLPFERGWREGNADRPG
ncbi:glucose-6-phosphate dehydrogenase [Nocardioides massiliensis]|uniref:Glucose-6-phosphate 1-dehydrogenase n=1 Tax=Nocardioides massiliensis TaxID=1325935 RepID=A0ABT9NP44_9ACTN|nr:glucose-6-phosphate dehydrogenase [Nocardioides massiliensis]MDP9822174.1 glucose-6-phosphate 1-dehydrogenase [Nocardioides massiliensis]